MPTAASPPLDLAADALSAAVALVTARRCGMATDQYGTLAGLTVAELRRKAEAAGTDPDVPVGMLIGQLAAGLAHALDQWNAAEPGEGDRWIRTAAEHAVLARQGVSRGPDHR